MTRFTLSVSLLALAGCGSATDEEGSVIPAEKIVAAQRIAEDIRDETHRFDKTGLVEAKVVPNNLAGKDFMPGGNLAVYDQDGKKYEVFFTLRRNNEVATFLAMDYRDILTDPKFIAHFGGFYGMDGETPTLVFQKNKYVIGVSGLELEDADQAGRLIAGYLQ